jgi:hypothetical protein
LYYYVGNVAELIIPLLEKKEAANLLSEKLRRFSDGRLFLLVLLMVALAMAASLSMVSAGAAEAKKNQSTFVFCDPKKFNNCRNTANPSQETQTFIGSGTPRTNNVSFRSIQTGTLFSSCKFLGTANGDDQYFCKTQKRHHHRRHHH